MTTIITASETFTQFIQGAPVATQVNTSDRLALIQGGLTKQIAPNLILGAQSPTIVVAASWLVTPADVFLAVKRTGVVSVQLPSGPGFNQRLTVADCGGNAGTYPITINAGAGDNIDGIAAFVLISNWQSVNLQYVQALNLWKIF